MLPDIIFYAMPAYRHHERAAPISGCLCVEHRRERSASLTHSFVFAIDDVLSIATAEAVDADAAPLLKIAYLTGLMLKKPL